jgi:drug/metabolite transporter (DMT)-like permease
MRGTYYFAVVTAVFIWSTSFVATKLAYTTSSPLTLGALVYFQQLIGGLMIILGVLLNIRQESLDKP